MYDRVFLKKILNDGVVRVTFNKVNGEERVMDCTLMRDVIPSIDKVTTHTRKPNDDVLPVWDVAKRDWRSFRVDSVTNVELSK